MTPSTEEYRLIPLTQGLFAKVDPSDYTHLMQWKWYAAKTRQNKFYVQRADYSTGKLKLIKMHRYLLGLAEGNSLQGDHVNGDTLDNRRINIRPANRNQNMHNRTRNKNNKSGYKGVCLEKSSGKYIAAIGLNGKIKKIGRYSTALEAFNARCLAIKTMHGEFARTI